MLHMRVRKFQPIIQNMMTSVAKTWYIRINSAMKEWNPYGSDKPVWEKHDTAAENGDNDDDNDDAIRNFDVEDDDID